MPAGAESRLAERIVHVISTAKQSTTIAVDAPTATSIGNR
jgi:hypothetical protein